jgi:agmatinase
MTIPSLAGGFDPSQAARSGTLWGLPFDVETARLVVLPVPWEVTVSYGAGTARGPEAILQASSQVDLYDFGRPDAWRQGVALAAIPEGLQKTNAALRSEAGRVIEAYERGETPDPEALRRVNAGCADMVARVRKDSISLLERGKLVGVLGGDHSVPLGLMQALSERYSSYGVLHVDAHSDLRRAYEGFEHSHASIMYNALEIGEIERVVQVGIRDTCEEEVLRIEKSAGRVRLYDFRTLARRRFAGETFAAISDEIIEALPEQVYVSFDIDGLDPALCPGTGTPVPGGLSFEEALYLVERIRERGRRIIGFDLCEVSPGDDDDARGEWDANVGARLLYRLCCAAMP